MQRLLLALGLIVLVLPATAQAARVRSAIFFYPWYSNPLHDEGYAHWQQGGHAPPFDLGSRFFPARGAYSSSDPLVLRAQMRDIAAAGVDEVVSSWWGKGSPEDRRLAGVIRAARAAGVEVAAHLEPYTGRTLSGVASDLTYLRGLGVHDVYVYRSADFPAEDWKTITRQPMGLRLFTQTNRPGFAAKAGFAGFYPYDVLLYGGAKFGRFCAQARALRLLCLPSVGPGYAARRATGDKRVKPRQRGATYDSMWKAALAARADLVTITSYNEWSEGTQIEPARRRSGYESYEGAYGLHGRAAQNAYLTRTRLWTRRFGRGSG